MPAAAEVEDVSADEDKENDSSSVGVTLNDTDISHNSFNQGTQRSMFSSSMWPKSAKRKVAVGSDVLEQALLMSLQREAEDEDDLFGRQ